MEIQDWLMLAAKIVEQIAEAVEKSKRERE